MVWVIVIILIIILIAVINRLLSNQPGYLKFSEVMNHLEEKENKTYIGSSTSNVQHNIVPKLLELVEKKGRIVVDLYTDSQYSKNKIGWYLNSYNFIKDYNQSDKYIAEVDFFDNDKRIGDIKRIVLKLNPNPHPIEIKDEPHIYKSSQIKLLSMKGLKYRDLTDDDLGKFYGYVKTEPDNKFDKYAIAIFNDKDKHVGYVPKGEEYLFNTLELIGGKQCAWGYIYKELHTYSGSETLKGNVYIPVKCSKAKIEKTISEFKTNRLRKIVRI